MNEKKVSDNSKKKNWYPEVADSYYYFLMFVLHIHFNYIYHADQIEAHMLKKEDKWKMRRVLKNLITL